MNDSNLPLSRVSSRISTPLPRDASLNLVSIAVDNNNSNNNNNNVNRQNQKQNHIHSISKEIMSKKIDFTSSTIVATDVIHNIEEKMAENEHSGLSDVTLGTPFLIFFKRISPEVGFFFYFSIASAIFNGVFLNVLNFIVLGSSKTIYTSELSRSKYYNIWKDTSIATSIGIFIFPLLYAWFIRRKINERTKHGKSTVFENPQEGQLGEIVSSPNSKDAITGHQESFCRTLISISLFIIGLGVYIGVNVVFYISRPNLNQFVVSTILSILLMVFNFLWEIVCKMMSDLQYYESKSLKAKWEFVKTFTFKLLTSLTILCFQGFDEASTSQKCPLDGIRTQLLMLLLTESLLHSILDIFGMSIKKKIHDRVTRCLGLEYKEWLPVFSPSEEYVKLIYRQSLILLLSWHFLFGGLLGTLVNFAQYWMDKYRVLQVSKMHVLERETKTSNSYAYIIAGCWGCMVIGCVFMYPFGLYWILKGDMPHADQCRIYNK